MNSDLMPSPESSNSTASDEAKPSQEATTTDVVAVEASQSETSSVTPSETANDGNLGSRQQPIPPPSEPMQYRAIGLVRGRYIASSEQFTQGVMLTADGTKLDTVLLGRIMSLVKNHLDLEQEHLWVVYPRTRQENDQLHLQIVGVWEPEKLAKSSTTEQQQELTLPEEETANPDSPENLEETSQQTSLEPTPSSEISDGGFSVRGEIVYQSYDTENLVIKIKQSARKPNDKPKYFKLKLKGKLETKAVGKFWDLQVQRQGESLVIEKASVIAELPRKRSSKPPFKRKGGGGVSRRPSGRKPYPPRRNGEGSPRPVKKVGESPSASPPPRPIPKGSVPKPVKRPKPSQE
ncbi:hypothetical protein [Fischerella sp. JS2]|uniref:hypothetical protein n=1 Tax=Fischerella sp. JS2 TaxID=2597771 RepID=UPI0028E3BCF1|nr:hypothetical protein [Fischerella sp. JS2]